MQTLGVPEFAGSLYSCFEGDLVARIVSRLEAEEAAVSGADISGRPSFFRAVTPGGNRGHFPPLKRPEAMKRKGNQKHF